MGQNFANHGWTAETVDEQMAWIEHELEAASQSTYMFVFGHHPTNVCTNPAKANHLNRLDAMFHKHKITAYSFGHQHAAGFELVDGVGYIQSGNAAQRPHSSPDNPPSFHRMVNG
jgi:hypothetical protein